MTSRRAARWALAAANVRLRALAAKPAGRRALAALTSRAASPRHCGRSASRRATVFGGRGVRAAAALDGPARLFKDAHLIAQSGLFDPAYYLRVWRRILRGRRQPAGHYVMRGGREGRAPCPLFDAAW